MDLKPNSTNYVACKSLPPTSLQQNALQEIDWMADHEASGMAREDDSKDDMEDEDEDEDGDEGKGGSKVKMPANPKLPGSTPKAKGKKVKKKGPKASKPKKGVAPVPLSTHRALEDMKGPNDQHDEGAGGGMAKVK